MLWTKYHIYYIFRIYSIILWCLNAGFTVVWCSNRDLQKVVLTEGIRLEGRAARQAVPTVWRDATHPLCVLTWRRLCCSSLLAKQVTQPCLQSLVSLMTTYLSCIPKPNGVPGSAAFSTCFPDLNLFDSSIFFLIFDSEYELWKWIGLV